MLYELYKSIRDRIILIYYYIIDERICETGDGGGADAF